MDNLEQVFDNLRKKNLRITKQRREIINILQDRHLTVQEIYEELKKKEMVNLATVYNNINFLLEQKILTELFINGKKHYDLVLPSSTHGVDNHIHVTCESCSKIFELDDDELIKAIKNTGSLSTFDINNVQLVLKGTCNKLGEDGQCSIDGTDCKLHK